MQLYWILTTLAFLFSELTPGATGRSESIGSECIVRGRIKIANPKTRLRGGSIDASGVVVWLTPVKGAPKPATSVPQRGKMVQRDKRFIPHIMAIQVGTEIDFPNSDPFFHNVFSFHNSKIFDLGLYANGESRPMRFNRPGISYIYCNIHPQMSAVIVTVETSYFAVSASNGDYSIRNVPAGSYELKIWHERSEEQQLAAQSRVVSLDSAVVDLGMIELDEAGYIPKGHINRLIIVWTSVYYEYINNEYIR